MRVLKHSLLNLRRRPTKPIMMFIIMFVVFGLVFTGVIVENSIHESKNYIRKELGGTVEYKVDYMHVWADVEELPEEEQMKLWEDLNLSLPLAEEISKDSAVTGTYIMNAGYLESETYQMAKEAGADKEEMTNIDYGGYAYFNLIGTKDRAPMAFDQEQAVLVDGEMLTNTSEDNSILISSALAARNNLAIGDEMKFMSWMSQEDVSFKIVGLFDIVGTGSNNDVYGTFKGTQEFSGMEEDQASSIFFTIDDPLNIPTFIERQESKLPNDYVVLDAADSKFEELTRPLDLMEIISKILIWVIFVAGALIIISIVTIFVRDRKFEVGLLLSSGESKGKIVLQFVSEILIVAIVAFSVSLLVSNQTSDLVGEWIVENQLVEDDNYSDQDFYNFSQIEVHGDVSMEQVADEFDVALGADVIFNLSLLSLAIVLFAACIPLVVIISYKPRKALQD